MKDKLEIAFKYASKKLGLQDIASYSIDNIEDSRIRALAYRYDYHIVSNSNWAENASEVEILTCALHECRHLYQQACIDFPLIFNKEEINTVDKWKYEFDNPINPMIDEIGYLNQITESDARNFAF